MNIDALDLKKLRAFYLVARHGSLRYAATRLNVSTSAVSVSVSRLESQLGIQLFERRPNKLVLTPVGKKFVNSAAAIFDGIDKILSESVSDIIPGGKLSISVSSDLAGHFIPKISNFLTRYSDVRLNVYINSSPRTLRLLESGEIQLGIGRFRNVPKTIEATPLIESSISLICPTGHPLALRKSVKLEDIGRYTLITLPSWQTTRQMIDKSFSEAKVRIDNQIEAGHCQAVAELVEAGIGIGLVHTFCARRAMSGRIVPLDVGRHFGNVTFSAIHQRQARSSPALFTFLQECTGD